VSAERDSVAAELAEYLGRIGLTKPWSFRSGTSTRVKYTGGNDLYPVERLDLHNRMIDDQLAKQGEASTDKKLGVVVTAGPPGAGKSAAVRGEPSFLGYRDIDADDFKDELLRDAQGQGDLTKWLGRGLCDGRPVSERELSGYVHAESTIIASTMRERCLAAGENIIIQGTLSDDTQPREIVEELDRYGYSDLIIVDVEVPQEKAIERALERWWAERVSLKDGIGGRFISPETIANQWAPGQTKSICAANAELLRELAESFEWDVDLRELNSD
jgi:dephospho-CoA kinase